MIYIIMASVLTFLLVTWFILSVTDSAWWFVGLFWGVIAAIALIAWLFIKGLSAT